MWLGRDRPSAPAPGKDVSGRGASASAPEGGVVSRARAGVAARLAVVLCAAALATSGCSSAVDRGKASRAHQTFLTENGRFRVDSGVADHPYTNAELVEHFEKVIFDLEEGLEKYRSEDEPEEQTLYKWMQPIRYAVVSGRKSAADRATLAELVVRLQRATGLTLTGVRHDDPDINMHIFKLSPEERAAFAEAWRAKFGAEDAAFIESWAYGSYSDCAAHTWAEDGAISRAFIYLSAEIDGLYQKSCLHEEITQALGPGNDHPSVKPSIFNDDEEFALLTLHDEQILQLLYHPRIRPGMTREEAMPIVREIVDEIRPEGAVRAAVE